MDKRHSITDDVREVIQARYDAERLSYVAMTPEARLQLDGDFLHDIAMRYHMDPRWLGEALGLDEEVIARARD